MALAIPGNRIINKGIFLTTVVTLALRSMYHPACLFYSLRLGLFSSGDS